MNRVWIMARRPAGNDIASALELTEIPRATLKAGDVWLRNAYMSMDAGTRMWMTAREDSYQPPLPVGSPVMGLVLGRVVESRHPDYQRGDLVRAFGQWADYSLVRPDEGVVTRVSWKLDDLRQHLGVFGFTGWTAYLGVVETGNAKAGETFVVSAAAGALGCLAGQIARILGCRVIGIAGSDDKCNWLRQELGFDGAVNYKTQNVESELRALCPGGINLYFENVGGPVLDAALPNMALYGRVVVSGLITGYSGENPVAGPRHFDLILMKRLMVKGFFIPDWFQRGPEYCILLQPWYAAGKLKLPFDIINGLEQTVSAYTRLFTGANRGKCLVKVDNDFPS